MYISQDQVVQFAFSLSNFSLSKGEKPPSNETEGQEASRSNRDDSAGLLDSIDIDNIVLSAPDMV